MNRLYFGDNLEIMREMGSGQVDLICTDPPFNSGRIYDAFFRESKAQEKAFTDIWQWDTEAIEARQDIRDRAEADDTYKALDMCLKGYDFVLQNAVKGNKGAMRAYLAFMGPRLAEMHRLLKNTGSLYLHCDPTASHYLKGVMDAIWDQANRGKNPYFRNEIIWHYKRWSAASNHFQRMHDTILYYSKTKECLFTKPLQPYSDERYVEDTVRGIVDGKLVRLKNKEGAYVKRKKRSKGVLMHDVWHDINFIAPTAKERLGYPTQKPIALYARMIAASSREGMLVMDPFCGCGTTIDAAETLNRHWIGIDLTIIALDPISKRMGDRHTNSANEPLVPHKDYEIVGYPTNMQEVYKLVRDEKRQHDFANWAVTRLGMVPTRNVGDGGKDGIGTVSLWNPETAKRTAKRIISEVKTGKPTLSQLRAFCHTMREQNAIAGVFITLEPVTKGMLQIAADMGDFQLENSKRYPRLQFWQISDAFFENPSFLRDTIKLPYNWIVPRKKSERHFDNQQLGLL